MKILKYILLMSACISLYLPHANAQYPRKVLYELFTNSECGPCVQANIDVNNEWAQYPDNAIVLKYHLGYPGAFDPFYVDNPVDGPAHAAYYYVNGLPSGFLDGTSSVVPQFSSRISVPSPFQIKTVYTVIDNPVAGQTDSVRITTTVKAGTIIFNGNLKLRTVAVLKYYGYPNGLFTEFHQVVRKLAPDSNGISLPFSFFTGDSVVYNISMPLNDVFDLRQLQIVSFVQDNATHEVKQAAIGVDDPLFKITSLNTTKPGKMINANGVAAFTFPFHIQTKNAENFNITLLPYSSNDPAWSQLMTINSLTTNNYNLHLPANADTIINVHVNVTCPLSMLNKDFIADIVIHNSAYPNGSYLDFNTQSPQYFYISAYSKCNNIITGGWQTTSLQNAFTNSGNSFYLLQRPLSDIDTVNFNKASIKNFFVCSGYDTLRNELLLMLNLLNSGGNVSLEGDVVHLHVTYVNAPPGALNFYNNYMGATFTGFNTQTTTVNTVTTDNFYGTVPSFGPYTNYLLSGLAPFTGSPNSVPVFNYSNTTSYAGLRNTNGGFKTVLLGFYSSMIALVTPGTQGLLVQSTINWFNSTNPTGTNEMIDVLSNINLQNFPNPANGITNIKITPTAGNKMLKVFDMAGRAVAEEKIQPNISALELNVSKLNNGIYTYSLFEDGAVVCTRKMVVLNE